MDSVDHKDRPSAQSLLALLALVILLAFMIGWLLSLTVYILDLRQDLDKIYAPAEQTLKPAPPPKEAE